MLLTINRFLLCGLTGWILACGRPPEPSQLDNQPSAKKYGLIADSLGASLFSKTKMADRMDWPAFDWNNDKWKFLKAIMLGIKTNWNNNAFVDFTDFYSSAYHQAIRNTGGSITEFSVIVGSTVHPNDYQYHLNNISSWNISALDRIVFALGSNDICRNTQSDQEFQRNYEATLNWMDKKFPDQKIYVITPPNIPVLTDENIPNYTVMGIGPIRLQCSQYFQEVCPNYNNSPRFQRFLQIIRDSTAVYSRMALIDISGVSVQKSDLSGDCFHPNESSHQRIGKLLSSYFSEAISYPGICPGDGRGHGCVWNCDGKKCAKADPEYKVPCLVTRFKSGELCR
jgi:hypothetical protein